MAGRARRLTNDEAREVRELHEAGASLRYLSWLYEVTSTAIHKIVIGKTHHNAGGPVREPAPPLTPQEVIRIRELRAGGMPISRIAEETDRHETSLREICSGKSFPEVGGPRTAPRTYRKKVE